MQEKKNILICTSGYYPGKNYGGPTISVSNLSRMLSNNFNVFIITLDRDLNSKSPYDLEKNIWHETDNIFVQYKKKTSINIFSLKRIISEVKPSKVYVNSLFDAKFTLNVAILSKFLHFDLIVAPRGELHPTQISIKNTKKYFYLIVVRWLFNSSRVHFHSTSPQEKTDIISNFKKSENKISVITNIPDIPVKNYLDTNKPKIPNSLDIIFLARISVEKNLILALELLQEISGTVNFHIYGNIENANYWEKCKLVIEKLPSNVSVEYKGICERKHIHDTFNKYHIFLFPTFSENFGHSIVESMLSNCLVLISANTPWTDINDYGSGWAYELSDLQSFRSTLTKLVKMNQEEYNKILNNNKLYISDKLHIDESVNLYNSMFTSTIN